VGRPDLLPWQRPEASLELALCSTARTLAQQLGIPLFAISTLASVVWTHYLDGATPTKKSASAVELPAQRGQAFAAIYQVNPAGSGLIQLLPDTVMTPEAWQQL